MTTITLNANGLEPLTLSRESGYIVRSIDRRPSEARPVVSDAPDTDGEHDTSSLHGGGSITFGIRLPMSDDGFALRERRLRAFTNTRLRPTLTFIDDDGLELQATVSRGSVVAAIERPSHRDLVGQWMVPTGVWESAIPVAFEVSAASVVADGLDWPIDWPIDWGTPTTTGLVEVTNSGDREAFPVLQLHGPWSGLTQAENLTTGRALVFDAESVLADNYIEIDTRAKTIELVDSVGSRDNRYHRLVFPDSDWWTLPPGASVLRFLPAVSSSPARMTGSFHHTYS